MREHMDAPVVVAALADARAPGGFRVCYQRSLDDRNALPVIDQSYVQQAVRANKALMFGRLPELPRGGFLRSTSDGSGSVLVAPMRHEDKILGYLAVRHPAEGMYGRQHVVYAAAAADVAALVVRNKNVADEVRARSTELRLMLETARALSSERNMRRLFARLHRLVGGVMDAGTFWVALGSWDQGTMTIPYCVENYRLVEIKEAFPVDGSLSGYVFKEGQPIVIRTAEEWSFYPRIVQTSDSLPVVSALAVPMRIGARPIGTISVQSVRPDAYSERDRDLMVAIAEQAAIAVENSQHLARADQRARELELLAQVSRTLTTQLTLKALCETVCEHVRRVMDASIFLVGMRNEDGDSMRIEYCMEGETKREFDSDLPLSESFAGKVLGEGVPIVLNSEAEVNREPHHKLLQKCQAVRSVAMAPLRLGERCIGVISAQSYSERAYDQAAVRLLGAIAEQLALAAQNAQLFADARNRADRDPLTNLFHHRYLKTRLEEEIARSRRFTHPLAVLMLDLDNFKLVNDTYGHPVGDDALRMLTSVLQTTCRTTDVIGRYGGDEFMVILPETDQESSLKMAQRIEKELGACVLKMQDGAVIPLHCSIGLSVYPADGCTPAELIAKADRALYQSKRQGRPMARLLPIGTAQMRLEGDFEPVSELLAALLARDPATRSHLEHVNRLAKDFAARLGLSQADTDSLLQASVLHDVGKIAIPDKLLRKPAKLTREEYSTVKRHPQIGAMLIEHIPGFKDAALAVMHHHERYDGKGYPDKLRGDRIPLLSRIVTLIDAFSAMTIDRPYHKGMTRKNAVAELRRAAGTQFDPQLVEQFTAMIESSR
jgi:diguanylate cyclase (GGDEF)-like protein